MRDNPKTKITMKEVTTMMTAYENWKKDTMEEESLACEEAVRLAESVKTCYDVDTDICTSATKWQSIPIADQSADLLDTLYCELEGMVERVRELMESIATLSDVRRELAETTAEDFED